MSKMVIRTQAPQIETDPSFERPNGQDAAKFVKVHGEVLVQGRHCDCGGPLRVTREGTFYAHPSAGGYWHPEYDLECMNCDATFEKVSYHLQGCTCL